MNKELTTKYNEIRKKYNLVDLTKRENWIRRLVADKERIILCEYLYQDVKPLIDKFQPEDRKIVHEYFRLIYKSILGDTNLIKSGFKIVKG